MDARLPVAQPQPCIYNASIMQDPEHVDYWKALVTVADHELEDAAYQEEVDQARVRGLAPPPHPRGGRGGVHKAVERDMHVMLSGKTLAEVWTVIRDTHVKNTYNTSVRVSNADESYRSMHADGVSVCLTHRCYPHQLEELEDGIHAQLQSGEAADPEYWSTVLDSMTLHKVGPTA